MHQRSSCANGRMQRRNSRTTKAMVKAVRKVHQWYSRTDERTRRRSSCTDDRGTKAGATEVRKMHLWSWNDGGKCGQSSGLSAGSRRMINDEAANARIHWTPRREGQDAATRLKLMLGSHRANFYVLHRINQVDHKKKKKKNKERKKNRTRRTALTVYSNP